MTLDATPPRDPLFAVGEPVIFQDGKRPYPATVTAWEWRPADHAYYYTIQATYIGLVRVPEKTLSRNPPPRPEAPPHAE